MTTLKAARAKVNTLQFGTAEWEAAMQVVRNLCEAERQAAPKGEFFSVDSGEHRTILASGRIIGGRR